MTDKRFMQRRYKRVRSTVQMAVNAADPMGLLIKLGAPEEEYSSEVDELVRRFFASGTLMQDDVTAVFAKSFGIEISPTDAEAVTTVVQLELDGWP